MCIQGQRPWLPSSVWVGVRSETEGFVCGTRCFLKGTNKLILSHVKVANHDRGLRYKGIKARGYYVSTVGKDEEAVREYIKHQEAEDRRIEQLNLF